MVTGLIAFIAIYLFIFARIGIVHRVRLNAIEIDCAAYKRGPSTIAMLLDLRKWTFAQFYPESKQ